MVSPLLIPELPSKKYGTSPIVHTLSLDNFYLSGGNEHVNFG